MVADVIINEGGNKIVRVIITRLQSQKEWNISFFACLFKLVGQQLLMQKFIILPLYKFGSKLEEDKGQTWSKQKQQQERVGYIYKRIFTSSTLFEFLKNFNEILTSRWSISKFLP